MPRYNHYFTMTILVLIYLVVFPIGCAKRPVVPYQELNTPAEVDLRLKNGEKVNLVVVEKGSDKLQVQVPGDTAIHEINRENISEIKVYPPEYDENGTVITRQEITRTKTNKNTMIYTIGGGVLSFGASLFLSSFIYRSTDDQSFEVINPISIGGTVLGTSILYWQGRKRDRVIALENIKEQRKLSAQQQLEEKRKEQAKLKEQIDKMKSEKARMESEKEKLKKELKKKKEKKEKKKEGKRKQS